VKWEITGILGPKGGRIKGAQGRMRAYARDVPPKSPNGGLVGVASGLPDA
jgi:hypothetical protein